MFIKRPGKGRKSYSLVGDDGLTLPDPRLDAINEDLRRGVAVDVLEQRMKALLTTLKGPPKLINRSNALLVEECHTYKIARKPYLVRPSDLKRSLFRAIESVGSVSLREASEKEIIMALKHTARKSRFDIVRALNELLIYCKRDFTLHNPRPPRPVEIKYVRMVVLLERAGEINNPYYKAVLTALFSTGCRWGELPMAKIDGEKAVIDSQVRVGGEVGNTKNKRGRIAPILPPLRELTMEYATYPLEQKKSLRLEHYNRIYGVCKRVLGCRLHDLRHSYAVEWGAVGSSTSDIARYIGDTEEVCERYYRNYCATPDEIARALNRWSK